MFALQDYFQRKMMMCGLQKYYMNISETTGLIFFSELENK